MAGREIYDSCDLAAHECFERVIFGDLGGGFFHADVGAKVYAQFEGGFASFRKRINRHDGSNPDIDLLKIIEGYHLAGELAGTVGSSLDGFFEQGGQAIIGHQHLQRCVGCALGRRYVLAQN